MKRSSVGGPLSRCGRSRPRRGILRFLGRLSPGYMYFELETTLERPAFLPPRPPSSWWRERTCVWRTQRTRSFPPPLHFHFHFSSALFSIPSPPLSLSLSLSPPPPLPLDPLPTLRVPARDSSCDAVSPPSSQGIS